MRRLLAGLALALALGAGAAGWMAREPADPCAARAAAMWNLPFHAFDQSRAGWRSLADSLICGDHAAPTIASYRTRHGGELFPSQVAMLIWHEAQVRASRGETVAALDLFRRTYWDGQPDWSRLYHDATIAFLEDDEVGLRSARDALAALPQRTELRMLDGSLAPWPPNLDVVDGLINCFGQPYGVAYSCRPPEQ